METFIFRSQFPVTKEQLFQFHEDPIGFSTLMTANPGIQVKQKPKSLAVGEVAILKVPLVPMIPFLYVTWIAKHTIYEKNKMFQDNQEKGPFKKFLHSHVFLDVEDKPNESILSDEVQISFYLWPISKYFIYPILYLMFRKRHQMTAAYFKTNFRLIFSGYSRTVID
ncbi:hypothetical protein EHQ59_05070 [Leptospira kemamanensis]|uniref:Cell division inhibitor n=1 Tax=Leptospira kemamanensis TaxID=2484942 RepID=A0A4R9JUG2_9LEPT|nr:hypothetical protein [Leptospira kemamanensis]TGL54983.1 hypothetical protein EHQ59_05070 [Leptospira kemamanensis]